jgi:hypothetical protein
MASHPKPPTEVRDVADGLIAALGDNLSALLWHGSWARGEATPASDHDMIVVLKQLSDESLLRIRDVFAERPGWSTYIKSEGELRQYPRTGRLQFHHDAIPLYGKVEPRPVSREDLVEDIRLLAVNIQHECRYRLVHGSRKIDVGLVSAFVQTRNARWMYYQAKMTLLALKARELLLGRPYPATRQELRERLSGEDELAIIDIIELWPELRPKFEADSTPLALQVDAIARKLVAQLDSGLGS